MVARPPKANSYHLVASHRHRGTFVTDISLDEMRVIFELRAAAEAFAVREAARDADKETLKRLIASVDAMEAAGERGDVERFVLEDMEFDLALGELSGYPVLKRIWSVLDSQVRRFIYQARGPPRERTARDPRVARDRAQPSRDR
jgi:DNA-binding GntR family transcriptional regulator